MARLSIKLLGGFQVSLYGQPVTGMLSAKGRALLAYLALTAVGLGAIGGNEIAVFTAIGMCWSGFLSTHIAMMDVMGYRQLTTKAISFQTVGGLCAGVLAHYLFALCS